jgi:hypothetical protein
MTRWSVLLFVVGLVSLCLFGNLLTTVRRSPVAQAVLSEKHIYAYRDWQSTGYTVRPGDWFTVRATGQWMYSPFAGFHGPEGHRIFLSPSFYPLPGVRGGALIGRIGENGPPFHVGQGRSYPARPEEKGLLYLRIDDDRLGDNRGYLVVGIDVRNRQ